MIELSHEIGDGVLVLAPKGRMDHNTAKSFEDQSTLLIDKGPNKIAIDFSGVEYISSAGLRAILVIAQRTKSAGGMLTFCAVNENVRNLFQVCGFDSVFGVHATLKEAKAALAG